MKSELPVSADALLAERARLEEELQSVEDWRELLRLKSRKDRGEPMSAVNTARLELVLIDALSQDPTFIRYKAVCVALERLIRGLPPFPQEKPAEVPQEDDLTQIRGITPSMARRLKALDVTSLAQIAAWRRDDIRYISSELDIGRQIIDQKWVAQAAGLLEAQVDADVEEPEPELPPRVKDNERRGDMASRGKSSPKPAATGRAQSERRPVPVLVAKGRPEPDWHDDAEVEDAEEPFEAVESADEDGEAFLDAVDSKAKRRGRGKLRDALSEVPPPLVEFGSDEDEAAEIAALASKPQPHPDPEAAPVEALVEEPFEPDAAEEAQKSDVVALDATQVQAADAADRTGDDALQADAVEEIVTVAEEATMSEALAESEPVTDAEAPSVDAPEAAAETSDERVEASASGAAAEFREDLQGEPAGPLPTPPQPKAIYAYPPALTPVAESSVASDDAEPDVPAFDASGLSPPRPLRVTRDMVADLPAEEAPAAKAIPADAVDVPADERSLTARLAHAASDRSGETAADTASSDKASGETPMSISEALAYAAEVAQRGEAPPQSETPVAAPEPEPAPPAVAKPAPPSTVRYEPPKSPRAMPPPRRMETRRSPPANGGMELPMAAPPPLPADYVERALREDDAGAMNSANGGQTASHDVGVSKVEIEEATVEIVRKGLELPASPKMVLRAPERDAAADGEAVRSATPIGRFLKALTGNQS